MDKLRVRVYNVRFGDAILVSVPDQDANGNTETRHILIDVGNAKKPRIEDGGGHEDTVFEPVVKNIVQTLAGRPLDLYVMTHEHWDHVQGLPYVDRIGIFPNEKLKDKLQVRHAWFTASADPDYYDSHPDAQKALDETKAVYETIERFLQAAPEQENPFIQALMLNNNPNATAYYVDRLRELAPNDRPWYVHRPLPDHPEDSLDGKHPFQQARFKIWAPEEDTSVYYRKLQPMALGVAGTGASGAEPTLTRPTPPPGVDAGAFYDLVETRRRGFLDNLLAIDKAKNNTSIVFLLEWRGWKLLFAGDAEKKSWQMMDKHSQLEEVHFLKVSHHGSHTGMPPDNLLDRILPGDSRVSSDGKPRYAVVSTYPKTYSNVPHQKTIG
ncbi:MAG: hypothetical protein OEV76_07005, partial [Anaerolineae bacterium]|nr:hypothetical protein [Anaerolineae bacterium]